MKIRTLVFVIAGLVVSLTGALADNDLPAASLLYLDQQGWEQASGETKAALATDFMRVFCGNPAMPAATLVRCLDHSEAAGAVFERALACVATAPLPASR